MDGFHSAVILILRAVFLIIYVALLLAVWRTVTRSVTPHLTVFGTTRAARFIGLAIATSLHTQAVISLCKGVIWVAGIILLYIVGFQPVNLPITTGLDASLLSVTDYIGSGFQVAQFFLSDLGNKLFKEFDFFVHAQKLEGLIYALAIWIFSGQLLSLFVGIADTADGKQNLLGAFMQSIRTQTAKIVALIAMFLMGVYLTVAAISVIPWLEETEKKDVISSNDFVVGLTGLKISNDKWQQISEFEKTLGKLPFAILQTYLDEVKEKPAYKNLASAEQQQVGQWLSETQSAIDRARDERKNQLLEWRQFQNNVKSRVEDVYKNAVSTYQLSASGIHGSQELAKYAGDISSQMRLTMRALESRLNESQNAISQSEASRQRWAENVQQDLQAKLQMLSQAGELESRRYIRFNVRDSAWALPTGFSIRERLSLPVLGELPAAPLPGTGWGPFSFVSGWLLRTQSFSLATISGMLGVGLLGASASTFIRRRLIEQSGKTTDEDLIAVVIGGFSAALVMFLAVRGGLAIFTDGATAPNPYTLLFACLVAAVFSEDAWKWARHKFQQSTSGQPGGQAVKKNTQTDTDKNKD